MDEVKSKDEFGSRVFVKKNGLEGPSSLTMMLLRANFYFYK